MKTTKIKSEASAPANVRPSDSVSKTDKQAQAKQQEFVRHCENRRMSTDAVLNRLQKQFPKQYGLAEVVGKWIWLESPAKTKRLASALWILGFHWNESLTRSAPIPLTRVPNIAAISPPMLCPLNTIPHWPTVSETVSQD